MLNLRGIIFTRKEVKVVKQMVWLQYNIVLQILPEYFKLTYCNVVAYVRVIYTVRF